MIGSTLSHYRIDAELGRGGMGIVYRAHDTKLNREVALKVLPSAALATDDDRARFYREAQAAAQLHHPNIATIFEIDEAVPSDAPHGTQPSPFIAMEMIDGESLEERINKGPLKLGEVIQIGTQIAEALKTAHAKEIVHRDVKSANVMLTSDGVAKVLDFGLAKTSQSTKLTRMGSTLGTIAYMSPEQARSEDVDGRTDLWALGVVLYEMIAGGNPFGGDYEQAVIYNILNESPEPLTAIRTGVSLELEAIVGKCLRKEASKRYQTAADLIADLSAVDLKSLSSSSAASVARAPQASSSDSSKPAPWIWGVVALAMVAVFLIARMTVPELEATPVDVTIQMPPLEAVFNHHNNPERGTIALSPDGKMLAFLGSDEDGRGLFVADLSSNAGTRRLTESPIMHPSFSPDGQWIAYVEQASIYRIPTRGGEPRLVTTQLEDSNGISWASDGFIYYNPNYGAGIWRVQPETEEAELVLLPDPNQGERGFTCSMLLPDGKRLLTGRYGTRGIHIITINVETGERTELAAGMCPRASADGRVLFAQGPKLMAGQLLPDGSLSAPVLISEKMYTDNGTLSAQQAIASDGSMLFVEGRAEWGRQIEIRSFDGASQSLDVGKGAYSEVKISPDGKKLAIISPASPTEDHEMYVYDLEQQDLRRITSTMSWEGFVNWLADSETLIYGSEISGQADVFKMSAQGEESLIFADSTQKYPAGPSSDGRFIAMHVPTSTTGSDIFVYDVEKEELQFVAGGEGAQENPTFSPDNSLIAYQSLESGQNEIYVVDYPPTGPRVKVSIDGGTWAQFAGTGRTLYYLDTTDLLRVELDARGRRIGEPMVVMSDISSFYSVFPDESAIITLEAPERRTLRFLSNWKLDTVGE